MFHNIFLVVLIPPSNLPVKFLKLYLHTTSPSPQGVTDDTVQGVPAWAYKDVCYQKQETMGFSMEITQC